MVLILIVHFSRRKEGGGSSHVYKKIFPFLMGSLFQPMTFQSLDHIGHGLGYQKVCRSASRSLSLSLLATPRCWIPFLLLTVIHEFLLNKEHLITPYSELLWDCSIRAPLPLVHSSSHVYDHVCEKIFSCL